MTRPMDAKMQNLPCQRLELDEIRGFVTEKAKTITEGDEEKGVGDVWTWCAIDAETKLVLSFMVGDRTQAAANAFVQDVAKRIAYRVQISTDGFYAYTNAIKRSFGRNACKTVVVRHNHLRGIRFFQLRART